MSMIELMLRLNQKGVISSILMLIILAAGIVGGLYLVQHPTFFKPKAAVEGTRIEVVDLTGNPITTTNSINVKVKLTYAIPSVSPTPSPDPTTPSEARVFITRNQYGGDLGGLSGADAKCQDSADGARLGGTWKARLVDSGKSSDSNRTFKYSNTYKLLDGTVIWNYPGDMQYFTMPAVTSILMDETRHIYDGRFDTSVWSNLTYAGYRVSTTDTCQNWTSKSSLDFGRVGIAANRGTGQWADQGTMGCIGPARLYCFEQVGSDIPTPALSSAFPTVVRVSNLATITPGETEYAFSMNGKIIDWNLANYVNSTEPGQKTIYAQFKVDGIWGQVYSTTVTYNPPSPIVKPQPVSGTTVTCSADNKSARLSWNKSEGATIYQLRVDDLTNSWLDSCTNFNSGDSCANVYTESHSVSTEQGHIYKWWLTAGNTAGDSSSTYGTNFNCPTPIVKPNSPSNLTANRPAPGTKAELKGDAVSGATIYQLRVDNKANGWADSCTSPNPGDSCANVYSPIYSFTSAPGVSYTWWV